MGSLLHALLKPAVLFSGMFFAGRLLLPQASPGAASRAGPRVSPPLRTGPSSRGRVAGRFLCVCFPEPGLVQAPAISSSWQPVVPVPPGLNLRETWVGALAPCGAGLGQTRGSWPVAVGTTLLMTPRLFSGPPGSRGPGRGLPGHSTSPDVVTLLCVKS